MELGDLGVNMLAGRKPREALTRFYFTIAHFTFQIQLFFYIIELVLIKSVFETHALRLFDMWRSCGISNWEWHTRRCRTRRVSPPELPQPSCRPRACSPELPPCEPIAGLVAKEIGDKLLCVEDANSFERWMKGKRDFFPNNIILINNCRYRYYFSKIAKLVFYRPVNCRQSTWHAKMTVQSPVGNRLAD